jgi:hypothetical protein
MVSACGVDGTALVRALPPQPDKTIRVSDANPMKAALRNLAQDCPKHKKEKREENPDGEMPDKNLSSDSAVFNICS